MNNPINSKLEYHNTAGFIFHEFISIRTIKHASVKIQIEKLKMIQLVCERNISKNILFFLLSIIALTIPFFMDERISFTLNIALILMGSLAAFFSVSFKEFKCKILILSKFNDFSIFEIDHKLKSDASQLVEKIKQKIGKK